ncbi:MAG: class I SAM-dependent methyltransferase [Alphaproteobacteria bacterium]
MAKSPTGLEPESPQTVRRPPEAGPPHGPEAAAAPGDLPALTRPAFAILRRIRWGALTVVLPDGRAVRFDGPEPGPEGTIVLKDYRAVRRALLGGGIGFADAYVAGEWDSPDLAAALEVSARNSMLMQEIFRGRPWARWMARAFHLFHRNTRAGSRRNISHHYDLGNAFYEKWLDPSMTYSSARFSAPEEPLSAAQQNKYRTLAERIGLGPGHTVLEIGSGWGGFAEWAAKTVGCRITGITISREQLDFARKRMFRQGLSEKVEIRFQDYRDVDDRYDRVASIEMFEAVGEAYWPDFFGKVRDVLNRGGKAGLQIITIADELFPHYRRNTDFIQRYIFPGGMLASPSELLRQVKNAGLSLANQSTFGQDYARTLNVWRRKFLDGWEEIGPLGFDERFKRIWTYYLAYCEAGFRARTVDVTQIALAK